MNNEKPLLDTEGLNKLILLLSVSVFISGFFERILYMFEGVPSFILDEQPLLSTNAFLSGFCVFVFIIFFLEKTDWLLIKKTNLYLGVFLLYGITLILSAIVYYFSAPIVLWAVFISIFTYISLLFLVLAILAIFAKRKSLKDQLPSLFVAGFFVINIISIWVIKITLNTHYITCSDGDNLVYESFA